MARSLGRQFTKQVWAKLKSSYFLILRVSALRLCGLQLGFTLTKSDMRTTFFRQQFLIGDT